MLTTRIKQLLYPLYIYPRISSFKKKQLQKLYTLYNSDSKTSGLLTKPSTGVKLFSNMEEDGIILWLMARLGIQKGIFIDIGSNDCINSNCANLVFNFNWEGIFIDMDKRLLGIGQRNYRFFGKTKQLQLKFVQTGVSAGNINEIISQHIWQPGIDFMSIDIDGNDYYIWKALTVVRPKIVVIENKVEYGWHDIAIPAGSPFSPSEWGASPYTMTQLAKEKGYTLVASNKMGFNLFYLRNDLVNEHIPGIQLEEVLNDPKISADFYDETYMKELINRQ
jgi:hypothetical protein